jgi:RNase P subunit RPR2
MLAEAMNKLSESKKRGCPTCEGVLAPLAVAAQTVEEGRKVGITVTHCRRRHWLV